MKTHIKDLVSLVRQSMGKDPNAAVSAEPFLITFQENAKIADNIEYEVPGLCSINIDVDDKGNLVDIEVY